MRTRRDRSDRVPKPREGGDPDALPHALTFFLSAAERRAVLRALRRFERDRARALLRALGIEIKR